MPIRWRRARPSPRPAPVTMATWPVKSIMSPPLIDCRWGRTLRWNRYLVNERGGIAGRHGERWRRRSAAAGACWRPRWPAARWRWRPARPGEPAWTDGITVFIDAEASAARQIESVTVQASLLAGGSLAPDVMRKLGPTARAGPALPRRRGPACAGGERRPAAVSGSAADRPGSRVARRIRPPTRWRWPRTRDIADPPASFGVIRARSLLSTHAAAAHAESQGAHVSPARREKGARRTRRRTPPTARTWRIRSPARSAAAGQSENCCNACCAGCVSSAAAGRREPTRRHIDHPTAFGARELSRRRRRRLPRSTTSMTVTAGSTRNGTSIAGATGMTGARSTSPIRPASRDIHSSDPMCTPCGDL